MVANETHRVARARAGDRIAFAELYAHYERRIYRFVYRTMGNHEDAAELTQETFLKAYRALGQTSDELNVNAWLHRIAANACLDVLRRRRRVRWLPWGALVCDDLGERLDGDPAEALHCAETRHAVQRTLLAQPPHYRQALLLREHEGLSCEEIGATMGLSAAAVKSLLFRAREDFRRRYGAPGAASDSGVAAAGRQPGRTTTPSRERLRGLPSKVPPSYARTAAVRRPGAPQRASTSPPVMRLTTKRLLIR